MKRLRIKVKEMKPHETSCAYIPHSIYKLYIHELYNSVGDPTS